LAYPFLPPKTRGSKMLKNLIQVTGPTIIKTAKAVKQDLVEKGCRVYLTSILVKVGTKNKATRHIVWRKPDKEDEENGLETEKVNVASA